MKMILIYDDAGKVVGTVSMTDDSQTANYAKHIEIDGEDFRSNPHEWAEVDVVKKTIHPKPGGVDPTGKQRKEKNK
jgi:hypothetical protein